MTPRTISTSITMACIAISTTLSAQTTLRGSIQTEGAKPLEKCSVLLLKQDSSLVKGTSSDAKGNYIFTLVDTGHYLLLYSFTGFEPQYSPVFSIDGAAEKSMGSIVLLPAPTHLKEAVVNAKKPLFEQKIDRTIVNIKNSITSAGTNVLDVLAKSPGVTVNKGAGTISMNGKDGVVVMINGKIDYMQPDAILQMLSGINSASVERIELITTPPAKYDAGGNAGYINIVLLSTPDEGLKGSYSAGIGVGHGSFPTAGIDLNYRRKKINLYGAYSFSREAITEVFENHRKVRYLDTVRQNDIVSNRDPSQTNHNARLGLDYQLTKRTVIGALVSAYDHKWNMNAVNNAAYSANNVKDTLVRIDNQEINHWQHLMGNLNLQHSIRPGEEISFNTDFLYYKDRNPTDYQNYYFDGQGAPLDLTLTKSEKVTEIKNWISQIDYSKKLNDHSSLQAGAKYVQTHLSNDVLVASLKNNTWTPDSNATGNDHLNEHIAAAYLSFDQTLGKSTTLKAGLRYEHTDSKLYDQTGKYIVNKQYGNLFPTIYFHQQLDKNNGINLSYNRRINRPRFPQLASYLIFIDPKTYMTGNPALQPSYTDAVKFDYILKRYIFSITYSYTRHPIIGALPATNIADNSQILATQNLDHTRQVYVMLGIPVTITNWWSSQLNIAYGYNQTTGPVNQTIATFSGGHIEISGSESFTLPKDFSVEISGFFQSKGYNNAGKVNPFGTLDAAVSKKIGAAAKLVFGVDNILNSQKYYTYTSVPGQNIETSASYLYTYPLFKLSWTQSFGNKILKGRRERKTASDDERRRIE